jgi:starch synthase (maltosyl-transferring)
MKTNSSMCIYNLFPLLAGTFSDWEHHCERAAKMGFTWIFVNPIQRPGRSGSLYSIADYFALNPAFFDSSSRKMPETQLKEMIKKAESYGLRVMIDLVINHCAVDSELLAQHPDWFQWDSPGNVAHPFADEDGKKVVWTDLAKFNYYGNGHNALIDYFSVLVQHLIDLGFKGFRCDAAYQVPNNAWERLINDSRKKNPGVLFLAETLGCTLDQTKNTVRAGFDYIFNSAKWWDFHGHWLMQQYHLTRETVPSISFPESHDTVRLCEELNGNVDGIKQRYLFAALFSAGVMLPIGFEFGFRKRLSVVSTRPQDWETTGIDLQEYVANVNKIKAEQSLLQEDGPAEILPCNNSNVLVLWKASASTHNELLLILNKDIYNKQYYHAESLYTIIQAGGIPLLDVSPEFRLDHIPTPFSYDLRPGQGIVLVTNKGAAP